jgi:hypothetical protein
MPGLKSRPISEASFFAACSAGSNMESCRSLRCAPFDSPAARSRGSGRDDSSEVGALRKGPAEMTAFVLVRSRANTEIPGCARNDGSVEGLVAAPVGVLRARPIAVKLAMEWGVRAECGAGEIRRFRAAPGMTAVWKGWGCARNDCGGGRRRGLDIAQSSPCQPSWIPLLSQHARRRLRLHPL